ncbi:MAG: hypothetical protein ABIS03_04885 [Gemmatimonadaceae bacterium]
MQITRLALPLWLLTAGCYSTVPLRGLPPAPGREVVVQLNDSGSRQLSGQLGPATIQLRGKPLASQGDTMKLAMIATTLANGEERLWNQEVVSISREYIATTGERVLSKSRTAGVVALVVAGLVAATLGLNGLTGTRTSGRRPPVTQ